MGKGFGKCTLPPFAHALGLLQPRGGRRRGAGEELRGRGGLHSLAGLNGHPRGPLACVGLAVLELDLGLAAVAPGRRRCGALAVVLEHQDHAVGRGARRQRRQDRHQGREQGRRRDRAAPTRHSAVGDMSGTRGLTWTTQRTTK